MVQGWAQDIRNLGGISFLQLRDRHGIVQITAPKKKTAPEIMEIMASLPRESVVKVTGLAKASKRAKERSRGPAFKHRGISHCGVSSSNGCDR